jgi:hypothetical protein
VGQALDAIRGRTALTTQPTRDMIELLLLLKAFEQLKQTETELNYHYLRIL